MCAICIEFQKGNLTRYEAQQALLELIQTEQIGLDHTFEVADLIEEGIEDEQRNSQKSS